MWKELNRAGILISALLSWHAIALAQSPCFNMDFETGTLAGWNYSGDVSIIPAGGNDPYGNFPQTVGNFSVQISNDVCGSNLFGEISRNILITPDNKVIKLHIAFVNYNDEFHDSTDAARFELYFLDSLGNRLACPKFMAYYDGSIDSFVGFHDSVVQFTPGSTYFDCGGNGPNNISYIPWYTVWVDLSNYLGQTLTLVARVQWCLYDVDWAYAYLDFECVDSQYNYTPVCDTLPTQVCGPSNMIWYEWYDSLGNLLSNNRCHTFTNYGTYTLNFANRDHCSDTDLVYTAKIPVIMPPFAKLSSDTVCFGDTSTLIVTIDSSHYPVEHIIWNPGNGVVDTTVYPDTIQQYVLNSYGSVPVTIIVKDTTGCTYTIHDSISVFELFNVDIISDSFICYNDTLRIIAIINDTLTNPTFTYIWDYGDGVVDTTADSVVTHYYNPPNSYSINVEVWHNTCKSVDTHLITVVPPPNVQVTTTAPVCEDSFFVITATGASIYEWLLPDSSTIIDSIISVTNASTNHAGTYIVKGTDVYGCIAYDTINVVVFKNPSASLIFDTVCIGDTTRLIVSIDSAFQPISQIIWHTGDGTIYTNTYPDTIFSHSYGNSSIKPITVVVLDSVSCRVEITDSILVYEVFATDLITDSSFCVGDTAHFTAITYDTLSNPNLVFVWTIGNSIVDSTTDSLYQYVFPSPGTFQASIAVHLDQCVSFDTVTVNVYPLPDLNSYTSPVCEDSSLIIQSSGADYYEWYFNNNMISNDSIVIFSPAELGHNGYYIVRGITIHGCEKFDTLRAIVWERPNITTIDTAICMNDTIQLNTLVTGGSQPYSYTWLVTNNISCTNCPDPTASPTTTTHYIVKVTDKNNCYNYDTASVIVFPLPVIDLEDIYACDYDSINIDAWQENIVKWLWTHNDILSCDTCPIVNITYTKGMPTDHWIKLWVQDTNTCEWTDSFKVIIDTGIYTYILQDTIVYVGEPAQVNAFTPMSNNNQYMWDWYTSHLIITMDRHSATIMPTYADTFDVVYEVKTMLGCVRSDTVTIVSIEPSKCVEDLVFHPNVFTPNEDGINDVLYVYSTAPVTVTLWRIYDQWGNLLFEARNQKLGLPSLRSTKGWDGRYQGRKLPPDVYVYYLEYICEDKQFFQKGDVSIIY